MLSLGLALALALQVATPPGAPAAPRPTTPPPPAQAVSFETHDGVILGATFHPPRDRNAPAIVLVHQLGSTREEWAPFVAALQANRDYAILAIDLRGHGQSMRTKDGKRLDWRSFTHEDWARLPVDVDAACDHLRERHDITPRSVGAMGSSIGASAVLLHAAPSSAVRAAVLLSPGLDHHHLAARPAAAKWGARPLLLVASEHDEPSAAAALALAKVGGRRSEAHILPGRAHGVAMATESPALIPLVVAFFAKSL